MKTRIIKEEDSEFFRHEILVNGRYCHHASYETFEEADAVAKEASKHDDLNSYIESLKKKFSVIADYDGGEKV